MSKTIVTDEATLCDMEENLRLAFVSRQAQHIAEDWNQFMRPTNYDRVHRVDGIRVRVRVEQYVTDEDTKPIRRAE